MESFNTQIAQRIPRHLGIILDGNGRWAQQRGEKRMQGHISGSENVISITRACSDLGVEALSLYAFSTENWKRPIEEVSALMKLLVRFIQTYLDELNRNRVRLRTMGDLSKLPLPSRTAVDYAKKKTEHNTGMVLNIGLNYGGRDEICRAVERVFAEQIPADRCREEDLSRYMDTADLPPLDLIIRTGGEKRLSNFMIWQAAYAEFYFSDVLWPDFSKQHLEEAFLEFAKRDRRFGGVK